MGPILHEESKHFGGEMTATESSTKDIGTLTKELADAGDAYTKAQSEAMRARTREINTSTRETNTINRLNVAQQAITKWYNEQRENAPHNTDWDK